MHPKTFRSVIFGTLASGVALAAGIARGDTILIFENSSGFSIGFIDSNYGHRVTANIQGGFSYGGTADTPNVVTNYSANTRGWTSNYGDLSNVAYTGAFDGILQLTLSADPGFEVNLHSFDLAGWSQADHIINSVQVLDGVGQVLFSQSNVLVHGDLVGPRHTTFSFPPLTAPALSIRFDASNLTVPFGAQVIGLDNVRFSQVPEPSSVAIALTGAACTLTLLATRRLPRPRRNGMRRGSP